MQVLSFRNRMQHLDVWAAHRSDNALLNGEPSVS